MVKIDLTKGDNPQFKKLVQDYDVKGVPTVVFLDGNGQERFDLRLVEFMKSDEFIVHMNRIR